MARQKDLNTAIKELKKDYAKVIKGAVQYATEKAKTDINNRALLCLEEYYTNYNPNSYDRSYSLSKAFVPYVNIKGNGADVISTVGIGYDANILDAYAGDAYNASRKYGRVDSEWVIDNYLDGIHPSTNGATIPGEVVYAPIMDSVSPSMKMEVYLENYDVTFRDNIYAYLVAHVLK